MQMKRSRAFMRKKETPQCACCGGKLNEFQARVGNIVLCDTCHYTLRERGFCHIAESGGTHTFWVLQDNRIRVVTLVPNQYAEFCKDPQYLMGV